MYIETLKLEQPANNIVDPKSCTDDQNSQKEDKRPEHDLEIAITLFIGRRKLILRKIWRGSVHDFSLEPRKTPVEAALRREVFTLSIAFSVFSIKTVSFSLVLLAFL